MELKLPSGPTLHDCQARLLEFCQKEYAYYDAIPDAAPDHIVPIDVLATVSMNSRVSSGERVQLVHRGMARACDPLLPGIPPDADLLDFDRDLKIGEHLLANAMLEKGVGPAVATKVLHRKRRNYIPILDSVVIVFYLDALGTRKSMEWRLFDKAKAIQATMPAWHQLREDLRASIPVLDRLRQIIEQHGWSITRVRTLEALIWMEAERRGYYRDPAAIAVEQLEA